MRRFILFALLTIFIASPAWANKHRAVWFWRTTNSVYGSHQIVGNGTLENLTLSFFENKHIKKVYGSYSSRSITEPAVVANWNQKLQAAHIESQFLMSENTWIFDTNWASFTNKISTRLINFNNEPGRTSAEKFDALHLDLEPQALSNWSSLATTVKRDYLFHLRDTYDLVRTHFINAGEPDFPVYADLPVWFDNLPIDGGSIGWSNAAERDQWFDDISQSLTGISLMPFDRTSFSSISNGVAWEVANITNAKVRVGIEADIGTAKTWPDVPAFNDMVEQLEIATTYPKAVDIQSYRQWREAIAAQPILEVAIKAFPATLATGEGELEFDGAPTWNFIIHHSFNLCDWREIQRFKTADTNTPTRPVRLDNKIGFWRVRQFED